MSHDDAVRHRAFGEAILRLTGLILACVAAVALHAAPSYGQAQPPPVKGPAAFKGTFDSYKSELGPPARTGDCAGDQIGHNNAGAHADVQNFDVTPSSTLLSANDTGPSTGAAHNGNYLTNGGYPGFNPFGNGTAKFGPSTGVVATKRSSASAPESDTVNEPCAQTAEGTLN